jgi:hypothetical protein
VAASSLSRLQTPLQAFFARKLSANFRPVGKPGETTHGSMAFRAAALQRGIVITEVNVNNIANHTLEISQEVGTTFAATGGTPASGSATGGRSWDAVDYAAASAVSGGIVPVATPAVITSAAASPPATGRVEVAVP